GSSAERGEPYAASGAARGGAGSGSAGCRALKGACATTQHRAPCGAASKSEEHSSKLRGIGSAERRHRPERSKLRLRGMYPAETHHRGGGTLRHAQPQEEVTMKKLLVIVLTGCGWVLSRGFKEAAMGQNIALSALAGTYSISIHGSVLECFTTTPPI